LALLNFTLGNTEYSEKYNLQKFKDSWSFVVVYSEYSQLTFADGWQPCCSDLCVSGNAFTEVRQMQITSFQQLGL